MSVWISDFHFLRPLWLLALALGPLALWQWRALSHRSDPWRRICDPALLEHLGQAPAGARGTAMPWLAGAAFVLLVLALSGPSFRQQAQAALRLDAPLIVAVDLSERMRATDLKPDRMSRLRFKLADLLSRRGEGQTALIGYAGDAFVVAPLTDDAASLSDLAAALSPDVMPVAGQRADRAIALAQKLLRDAGETRGDLLLMTDRVDGSAGNAARRAHEAGLRVSVLGVGTAQGAPVPRARGGFLQDEAGTILLPKLETAALEQLARLGGGRYAEMGVDDADLRRLGVLKAPGDAGLHMEEGERNLRIWRDEGPWLLLALLPLAALAFRRGWLAVLVLSVMLPSAPAQAFDWESLWKRPDQRAWEALQQGDAQAARELARDPAIGGAAAYRAEDYPAAIDAFAHSGDAVGSYNLGNALARAARYQEALDAYDRALAQQPDFPDAAANRKAVEDWLRQQQEQQEQGDSSGKQSSSDSQQGEGQRSEGDESQSGKPDEENRDSAQSGQESKSSGDPSQDSSGAQDSRDEEGERQRASGDKQGDKAPSEEEKSRAQADEDAQRYAQEMQQALENPAAGEQAEEKGSVPAPLSVEESEQLQKMEHLLQRVPDDPGGLLRRKFQLELQRRQREGENR